MDDGLKKRLIGAAVLASLAVIFVPMLFEEAPPGPPAIPPLPGKPPVTDFASQMLRDTLPDVTPLAPDEPKVAEPAKAPPAAAAEPTQRPVKKPERSKPPTPQPGLTAWVIQVGSFSNRDNARKLVGRLRDADLPTPDPELVTINGKRFYRVRVGPVVERARAEGMVAKVSAVAGTQAKVQRYP